MVSFWAVSILVSRESESDDLENKRDQIDRLVCKLKMHDTTAVMTMIILKTHCTHARMRVPKFVVFFLASCNLEDKKVKYCCSLKYLLHF